MPDPFATHEVANQPPPLGDCDLWEADPALREGVAKLAGDGAAAELAGFGRLWGRAEFAELGRLANENPPKLKTHDAKGFRADLIEFHPAYHALMGESIAAGLHCSTWGEAGEPLNAGEHVFRAARIYMAGQVEAGHLCPIVMTHAATAALRAEPALAAEWLPKVRSRTYDPAFRPAAEKDGVTLGMGMTEKQGGSDVRANTTRAEPDGDGYRIIGHKWFMSAPMCDAFLVLAQAPGGLTCFLLPRFRPDGSPNALRIVRLKDKLGNRSNASSEVEFEAAYARRCGPEGDGIKTIIAMVQLTRLDCAVHSAGLMRAALAQAVHHARHRRAFQRKLVDQPLMRAVLADLALEREAALALALRLAQAFDRAPIDADEAAFARIVTPAAKLWICKAAPGFIYESLECIGGNGYVEEGPLARLYREAPLNAIWEGSGNIMALDLLRGLEREREAGARVIASLAAAAAELPHAREALARIEAGLRAPERESLGRQTAASLAYLAAAAALAKLASPGIAAAFAETRLRALPNRNYGNPLPAESAEALIERSLARPH